MKKNEPAKKILITCIAFFCGVLLNVNNAIALTVINKAYKGYADHGWPGGDEWFRAYLGWPNQYALDNKSQPDSCWDNFSLLFQLDLNKDKDFSTGISGDRAVEYVCLKFVQWKKAPTVKKEFTWAINPIKDVTECVVEVLWIDHSKNGLLKATPACGYVGRCEDKEWYGNREACCPTGHWVNGTCS